MNAARFAYRTLCRLAHMDGSAQGTERSLLERYRKGLGLSPEEARKEQESAGEGPWLPPAHPFTEANRRWVIEMMARVACADGSLSEAERSRIFSVAETLGAERTEVAALVVGIEDQMHGQRSHHRRQRVMAWSLALAAVLIGCMFLFRSQTLDAANGFQTWARSYGPSVLLLRTDYSLIKAGERHAKASWGSGFFVTGNGLIATNKHVVQPWLFDAAAIAERAQGWDVDPASVRYQAWAAGSQVGGIESGRERGTADFDSRSSSLSLAHVAPDSLVSKTVPVPGKGDLATSAHRLGRNDLALLRAVTGVPVRALPLSPPGRVVAQGEALMAIGYPDADTRLEMGVARCSTCLGHATKVEDSIEFDGQIVPGSSGGPLVDEQGFVVGVVSSVLGKARTARCIQSEHLRAALVQSLGESQPIDR